MIGISSRNSRIYILDILYKGLSGSNLREFIQTKIEAKRTSKAVAVTLDIDTLLDEISTRLPAEINQSKSIDSSEPKSNDDTKNKSPTRQQSRGRRRRQSRSRSQRRQSQSNTTNTTDANTTIPTAPPSERCSYCRRYGHEDSSCHYKNPHMRNEAWRRDNRHLIEHFKAQHEKYTKNSPAILTDNQDASVQQYANAAIPIGLNSFQIAY
ncbi:hypothetical protein GX50_05255 [[Emmonsia] crescens]|uniref:Uncharacterized protein n=1 Tax=[Emmonsia] crescens TaxID=73230 RepID=A0A2B7Z733_9EURO|nr:hypothetical protein GX50_08304 [Emmonsia crescens]PGH31990.1 hypothetical protein GX50_05255 [Emmonsia crescens]